MIQLARLMMKTLLLIALLLFTSTAELTCDTSCKDSLFAAVSMSSFSEDEAIRVVLCNSSCDGNGTCINDCLQQNHSWTRASHPSNETLPPPALIQANSTAVYSVVLLDTLINVMDGIIVKIEPVDASVITLFIPLMLHGEREVSLAPLVCSKVIVSYATVNSSVVSGFSESTELCVNQSKALPVGTMMVGISFKWDERLPRHAILNVTWETQIISSSDADSLVEYYALEIAANDTRADCDDLLSLNVTIQPQENSYVLQQHVGRDVPKLGCNYSVTITAIPSHHISFTHFYIPSDDSFDFKADTSNSSSTLNLSPSSSFLTSSFYDREETILSMQHLDTPNLTSTSLIQQITSQLSIAQTPTEYSSVFSNPNPILSLTYSTVLFTAMSGYSNEAVSPIPTSIDLSNLKSRPTNSVFVTSTVSPNVFLDVMGPTPNLMDLLTLEGNGEKIFHKLFLDIPVLESIPGKQINTETPFLDTFHHNSASSNSISLVPVTTEIPVQTTLSIDAMTTTLQNSHLSAIMTSFASVPISLSVHSPAVSVTTATLAAISLAPTPSLHIEKSSSQALSTSSATSLSTLSATPRSVLSLQCTVNFNPSSGLYYVLAAWTNYIDGVTTFFCVLNVKNHLSQLNFLRIPAESNKYQYSWMNYNISPVENSYIVTVSPVFPDDKMGQSVSCEFQALSVPPDPITSINTSYLILHDLVDTISLNITWGPARYANGMLSEYQLYIGIIPLLPTESDQTAASHWRYFKSVRPYLTQLSLDISVPPNLRLLYLQMRQSNQFLYSNWSNPRILNLTAAFLDTPKRLAEGSGLPLFTFWVIGAGGSLIISFVFTLVCSCTRQRRHFDYGTLFITGKRRTTTLKPEDGAPPFSDQNGFLASTLTFDEWEVPRGEITIMENEPLGKGFFGEVFRGEVTGFLRVSTSSLNSPMKASVAVKRLKRSASSVEKANFLKEIEMMKTVSHGGSELSMYVVNMVGCVTAQEPLLLLVEFVKYGDLLNYLRFVRKVMEVDPGRICPAIPYMEPRGVYSSLAPKEDLLAELGPVEDLDLLNFARQIAAGMEYLSNLNIVHRDLACRNILIGRNKLLKISDFGMSRVVMGDEVYINSSHGRLPLRWMAVESIYQREFTIASDVWAYGIVLWEIATMGGFPYVSVSNRGLTRLIKDGVRLERPSNCSNEIYNIMLDCWRDNPNARPKFCTLRRTMKHFLTTAAQNEQHSYFLEGRPQSPYIYHQVAVPHIVTTPEDVDDALEMTEIQPPLEWLNVATPMRSSLCGFEGSHSQAVRRSAASSLHSVFSEPECLEVRYVASPIHSVHTSARQSMLIPSEHMSPDLHLGAAVLKDELPVQLGRKLTELSSNNEIVMEGTPLVSGNLSAEQTRQD